MYTIGQVAERTGISAHTLRYYDKEGLLTFVDRSPSGNRRFKDNDFEWLAVITCLKSTGMPIRKIREFIQWCREGDSTLERRLEMFREQKREVEAKMAELRQYLEMIDYKIRYYGAALRNGTAKANRKTDPRALQDRIFAGKAGKAPKQRLARSGAAR